MSDLQITTEQRGGLTETVRLLGLSAFTAILAIAFLVLLVSDQVQAAGL